MRQGHPHPTRAGRSLGWSAWTVVLVLVVAGGPAAEVFCHEEHTVDEHCAACQLPLPPAADPSRSPQIGLADPADAPEPAGEVVRARSRLYLRQPARAPPA